MSELEAVPHSNYKCSSVCGIFGIIANCKVDINDPEAVCKPVRSIIGIYIFLFHPRDYYKLPLCVTFINTFDNLYKS